MLGEDTFELSAVDSDRLDFRIIVNLVFAQPGRWIVSPSICIMQQITAPNLAQDAKLGLNASQNEGVANRQTGQPNTSSGVNPSPSI
jgi:hypothetical protein